MGLWKQRRPSGVTYVIDAQRYWDEEQQKYRVKQKCIGKLDPDTGEIVPNNGKRGPKFGSKRGGKRSASAKEEIKKLSTLYGKAEERVAVLRNHIKELNQANESQSQQISRLASEVQKLKKKLNVIRSLASITLDS